MLTKMYLSMKMKWDQYVKNERGAQALEWIALGMLVLAIMGAIAATMKGDSSMGTAVKNQLVKMINSLSGD